jgi:hypothetical protein
MSWRQARAGSAKHRRAERGGAPGQMEGDAGSVPSRRRHAANIARMPAREFGQYMETVLTRRGIFRIDDYVLFGSAVMKLHGLKDDIGDVDVFVAPRAYALLRDRSAWTERWPREGDPPLLETRAASGLLLHAFYAWAPRDRWMDVPAAFVESEVVHGVYCVPLSHIARHKQEAIATLRAEGVEIAGSPWEKHEHDLALIEKARAA